MAKRMLHGIAVELPATFLCDDITADTFTAFVRVFYQAKAYPEKDLKVLAGMIHLGRLPIGTELQLHVDDDERLWPHWRFARALRQRCLPNKVFTCCAVLRSVYGQRLTPSELGSDVHAVACGRARHSFM